MGSKTSWEHRLSLGKLESVHWYVTQTLPFIILVCSVTHFIILASIRLRMDIYVSGFYYLKCWIKKLIFILSKGIFPALQIFSEQLKNWIFLVSWSWSVFIHWEPRKTVASDVNPNCTFTGFIQSFRKNSWKV